MIIGMTYVLNLWIFIIIYMNILAPRPSPRALLVGLQHWQLAGFCGSQGTFLVAMETEWLPIRQIS